MAIMALLVLLRPEASCGKRGGGPRCPFSGEEVAGVDFGRGGVDVTPIAKTFPTHEEEGSCDILLRNLGTEYFSRACWLQVVLQESGRTWFYRTLCSVIAAERIVKQSRRARGIVLCVLHPPFSSYVSPRRHLKSEFLEIFAISWRCSGPRTWSPLFSLRLSDHCHSRTSLSLPHLHPPHTTIFSILSSSQDSPLVLILNINSPQRHQLHNKQTWRIIPPILQLQHHRHFPAAYPMSKVSPRPYPHVHRVSSRGLRLTRRSAPTFGTRRVAT